MTILTSNVAKMFERLGLSEKINHKTSIFPTGKTAMEALAAVSRARTGT